MFNADGARGRSVCCTNLVRMFSYMYVLKSIYIIINNIMIFDSKILGDLGKI